MIRVVVEAELLASGQKKTQIFRHSPILIGRGEDADLRIDLGALSGIHGQIVVGSAGDCEYVDLSSRNGSWLDGRRLVEEVAVRLAPESTLILAGVASIRVRSGMVSNRADDPYPLLHRDERFEQPWEGTKCCSVSPNPVDQSHVGDAVLRGAVVGPRTSVAATKVALPEVPSEVGPYRKVPQASLTSTERTAILPSGEAAMPFDGGAFPIGFAGGTRILSEEERADRDRSEFVRVGGDRQEAILGSNAHGSAVPRSLDRKRTPLVKGFASVLANTLKLLGWRSTHPSMGLANDRTPREPTKRW